MDYIVGTEPSLDLLSFINVNSNGIMVVTGARANDAMRWYEGGLGLSAPSAAWFGCHVERYACDDGATLVFWTTRDGTTLELQTWPFDRPPRQLPIPGTNAARGVTRTPRGDFYIADDQNDRVIHLSPTGALIDSFAAPGTSPGDLSYGE